jgi:hypothetical protein
MEEEYSNFLKASQIFQVMHCRLDRNVFIEIYGEKLGEHLWGKREQYAYGDYAKYHDEAKFMDCLDPGSKVKMFCWAKKILDE